MGGQAIRPVVIANGQSVSAAFFVEPGHLTAIIMPASWDTANLTLLASPDNAAQVPYNSVYDKSGTEYLVTAAASRYIAIPDTDLRGLRWIQIRSGTAGTPVNQTAARTLYAVISD